MARDGRKIAMLTAYGASFAALCDRAGIDVFLVGDSLGMVIQGQSTMLPVTLEQTLYHTRCVVAGCARPLDCAGQVLVIYDALGIQPGNPMRFVKNFLAGRDRIESALAAYVAAVKDGSFPAPEHSF